MRLLGTLAAVTLATAALAVCAPAATAGTYTVDACMNADGSGVNNSWNAFADYGAPAALNGSQNGSCQAGIGIGANIFAPVPWIGQDGWVFTPAPGTSVAGLAVSMFEQWSGAGWAAQIDNGSSVVIGPCYSGMPYCGWDPVGSGAWGWYRLTAAGSWPELRAITWCWSQQCSGSAHAYFANIQVTVSETTAPTIAHLTGPSGWTRGTATVGFDASDPSGIERAVVSVDGTDPSNVVADTGTLSCDFTQPSPCANAWGRTLSFDTRKLSDGPHTYFVAAENAAGNWSTTSAGTFSVSNSAPAPPAVTTSGGWQGTNSWTLHLTSPSGGDPAPVASALYRVCNPDGSGCRSGTAAVGSGSITGSFGITTPGSYTVSVQLVDAAGNTGSASNVVALNWDTGAPAGPQLSAPPLTNGWLGGAAATTWAPQLTPAGTGPASGIAGYAVTTDGSTPSSAVNVPVGPDGRTGVLTPPPGGWTEGTDTIEARAISNAGIASPSATVLQIHVDRTSPAIRADGYGNPAPAWQPGPVNVRLTATDPLSGVGAADDGAPATGGAYVAYAIDTGAEQTVRGGSATATVAGQGRHWITFRAADVAGNVSQPQTIYVNVGSPEIGSFDPSGFWAQTTNPASTFTAARSFGSNCPARAVLTAQADTYLDESDPTANEAGRASLLVRSAPGADARTLLDFALPSASGCSVSSAELRLYATSAAAGRALTATRAGSAWTESAVSWATRPGPTGPPSPAAASAGGWVTIDVTAQIQDTYEFGDNGLLVRDAVEGDAGAPQQAFSSTRGPAGEAPQLVVTFG